MIPLDPHHHPAPFRWHGTLRTLLLAVGVATGTVAAAQSAPEVPTNPDLGPAFATRNAAYVPILLDEIPGWENEDFGEAFASFSTNCRAMKRRSAWAPLCAKLAGLPRNETFAVEILAGS